MANKPRHGARLDAADPQWHLTSPTPYDPPLTYGGWTQCRALGARIAALLQAREAALDADAPDAEPAGSSPLARSAPRSPRMPPRHRDQRPPRPPSPAARPRRTRHRIVVHSSPFLRCVQTATAVAAGLSQYHAVHAADPPSARTPLEPFSPAPFSHQADGASSSRLTPHRLDVPARTSSPARASSPGRAPAEPRPFAKPRLRLDAFLGEWLSPDYFEDVAPPPGSALLLAGAKAELLRRGEPLDPAEDPATPARASPRGLVFPGGWARGAARPSARERDGDDDDDPPAPDPLARLTLSPSAPAPRPPPRKRSPSPLALRTAHADPARLGYVPPRPRQPLRPVDPIPAGYAAHARDACLDVDYAWDSRGPPLDWGGGGGYGEEWSAMHRRFRAGVARMVAWYRVHADSAQQGGVGGHQARRLHPVAGLGAGEEGAGEEEEDTVLVLVTHGAGCNALIGALTGQPVLLDVGMASLTMAVRREEDDANDATAAHPAANGHPPPLSSSPATHGPLAIDRPLAESYAVLLTASTEHLRAGSHPLAIPGLDPPSAHASRRTSLAPSPAMAIPARSPRHRLGALGSLITRSPIDRTPPPPSASASAGTPQQRSDAGTVSAGPGNLQRSATVAGANGAARGAGSGAGNGLWRKPAEGVAHERAPWLEVDGAVEDESREEKEAGGAEGKALWGKESFERPVHVKRRWTVLEGR